MVDLLDLLWCDRGSGLGAHCLFQTEKENNNNLDDKWHRCALDILQSKKQNAQTEA